MTRAQGFIAALRARWADSGSMLCVGLDPEIARLPASLAGRPDAIFEFCRDIVDATAPFVCAFKPQIAHFAAIAAEDALQRLIAHIHAAHPGIPVILDAKRGDIGSTARMYAIEAFERYDADAVTVNPYLGLDSAQPFLDYADRGVVVLCHTSNPGARDFQEQALRDETMLDEPGVPLYLHVASTVATQWNGNGNCALVVGATYPEELALVRARIGDMPLLVPGIGAQGGDVTAVVAHGADARGTGLVISTSRAVLFASSGADYSRAAADAARVLRDEIAAARKP